MTTRWIIEGEWSGYTSSQRRICHREVTTSKAKADRLKTQHGITFTDGTTLCLRVRPAKDGERVVLTNGYNALIDECYRRDIWSVAELQEVRK